MAVKTVSLKTEAYERLKAARRYPGESFSEVILRARWPAPFHVLSLGRDVWWEYGKAFRYLQANGLLIGANDLWIAAAGLAYRMPVVTRNTQHYQRVPGLEVVTYS
jgi:predicted nucleic acid-binding protein